MVHANRDSPFRPILHPLGVVIWSALYFITLGFSHKYRERLRSFERLDPQLAIDDYNNVKARRSHPRHYSEMDSDVNFKYTPYNSPPTYLGRPYRLENCAENCDKDHPTFDRVDLDYDEPIRARQRGEWEKLSTAASVITATSAAALAIPDIAGSGAFWMVNTCFCIALGVSLEGLILVFYITIMASGASDETIGRLARGQVTLFGSYKMSPRFPALVMALPVVFATYSSVFLLIGCTVMIMMGPKHAPDPIPNPYYYLPLVPIGFGFICGCSAVLVSEVATHREEQLRRRNRDEWAEKQREIVLRAIPLNILLSLPKSRIGQVGVEPSEREPTRRDLVCLESTTTGVSV